MTQGPEFVEGILALSVIGAVCLSAAGIGAFVTLHSENALTRRFGMLAISGGVGGFLAWVLLLSRWML